MKVCRFCERKVKKLVDAHILPRAFFEYTRSRAGLAKDQYMEGLTNTKGTFPKGRVRKGWHDPNLICSDCEPRFHPYDDYAIRLLLKEEWTHKPIIINGEVVYWEVGEFDFNKLRLFMISVLWRAGASDLLQFRKIMLGSNLQKLKQNILGVHSEGSIDVSFILARFPDELGQSFMADPHPEIKDDTFAKLHVYRFYLGAGYVAYIKVDNKPFPNPVTSVVVSDGQALRILKRGEFATSKEAQSFRKVIMDVDKIITEVKTAHKVRRDD